MIPAGAGASEARSGSWETTANVLTVIFGERKSHHSFLSALQTVLNPIGLNNMKGNTLNRVRIIGSALR